MKKFEAKAKKVCQLVVNFFQKNSPHTIQRNHK